MSTQKPSYIDFFRTFLKLSHLRLWITHVRNDEQKYHLKSEHFLAHAQCMRWCNIVT